MISSVLNKVQFKVRLLADQLYYKYKTTLSKVWAKDKIAVHSIDKTIDDILHLRLSVSRYGDGEMRLMCGESIEFQVYSPELGNKLAAVLKASTPGHICGLPEIFQSVSQYKPLASYFWQQHLRTYWSRWAGFVDRSRVYYNSFITRPYITFKDRSRSQAWFHKLAQIWNDKDVIMVEGAGSRLGVGNNLFENTRSIRRILCPTVNAFDSYAEILNAVLLQRKDNLILIALGPTATVLAYDLHLAGYHAIDVGHVDIEYEWFLMKADWKVSVKNKHTNEAVGSNDVGTVEDRLYNEQIISVIE